MPRNRLVERLIREMPGVLQEDESEESAGGAVLMPRSRSELSRAVKLAREVGAKLEVPGGHGRGAQALVVDLRRMAQVLAFDDTSRLVHAEAGIAVADLEEALNRRELTLGLRGAVPETPVGAWLAFGAPGAPDTADDPVRQLVVGLEAVMADGEELVIRPAPRRAVGPDLVAAMIGDRGRLGILVGVHLHAVRRSEAQRLAFVFPSLADARKALAWIRGDGVRPRSAQVTETGGEAHLLVELAGPSEVLAARRKVTTRIAEAHGGSVGDADHPMPQRFRLGRESEIVAELASAIDDERVIGS